MNSKHPFQPFVPKDATKLIIGTIPPPRFCRTPQELEVGDVNFYYGSRDNKFWELLSLIFVRKFEFSNTDLAIKQRQSFLSDLGIGITDIVDECVHKNNSASDNSLNIITRKDVSALISEFPTIKTFIYTSQFVKSQINLLYNTYHSISKEDKKYKTVEIQDRRYNVKILYSPSPQALRNMGKNGAEKRIKQYRDVFVG